MEVFPLLVVAFVINIGKHYCITREGTEFRPMTESLPEFRKIALDFSGKNIYVGGKNFIYHLDEDLRKVGVVQTGPRMDSKECTIEDVVNNKSGCNVKLYDDYTQLLQVYEQGGILVSCGTVYLGRCVGRDLRNISNVKETSTSYLVVSVDETGSTESLIANIGTEPVLFVGKSYVPTTEELESLYTQVRDIIYGGQIKKNKFMIPYETDSGQQSTFSIKTVNKHGDQNYTFVMKSMLYMSDVIYTLMRIRDQTTNRTVSKVSKMCAMDTAGTNSYEDMPIECSGFPYVQDGFVIQHGGREIVVALFSSTEDVTKSTPSAVCVFSEDELLDGFRKSRMNSVSCGNLMGYPVDYLEITADLKCLNTCSTSMVMEDKEIIRVV